MIRESLKRTVVKTLSWRVVASLITFLSSLIVVFWLTSIGTPLSLASAIASIDFVLKLFIYFVFERVWSRINYGRLVMHTDGCCLWFTGLSGAGKTTIALELIKRLEKSVKRVEYLDGDIVRNSFCADLGFSKEDRDENISRISYVASYLSQHSIVICAFISPYRVARAKARDLSSNFVEVYVECPLEVCIDRDVKGLYKKALAGEIANFTGVSDPYEAPEDPELTLDTSKLSVDDCADIIMEYLKSKELL